MVMISVAEAKRISLARIPVLPAEPVALAEALGRVLAADVASPIALPPFDNSAMDGFAVHVADVAQASAARPVRLPIAFDVAAGRALDRHLAPGTACRIMTGAAVPPGADGVIPVEDVTVEGRDVLIPRPVRLQDHCRPAGGDLAAGAPVMAAGTAITAGRLGLLAAVGLAQVPVHRRPRVAILTTGDELIEVGQPLAPGEIYNSNAYAMAAMVAEAGAVPVRLGMVRDDRESTRQMILAALDCDLVLTSGGVSMGEFDYVSETLAALGEVHFTRVAQQPGKPLTFAMLQGKPVYGLPGNPVSTMVCLEYYVRPALRRMMGHQALERPRITVRLAEPLAKKPGRLVFLRARVQLGADGFEAHLTGPQGSNIQSSMAWANALVLAPAESGSLPAGERVEALVLDPAAVLAAKQP